MGVEVPHVRHDRLQRRLEGRDPVVAHALALLLRLDALAAPRPLAEEGVALGGKAGGPPAALLGALAQGQRHRDDVDSNQKFFEGRRVEDGVGILGDAVGDRELGQPESFVSAQVPASGKAKPSSSSRARSRRMNSLERSTSGANERKKIRFFSSTVTSADTRSRHLGAMVVR